MSRTRAKAGEAVYLKVGEVAEKVGMTSRAIRYYEELNLLGKAPRSVGGFRLFTPEDIHRLETISALQELGLPLAQIRELADVWSQSRTGREVGDRLKLLLTKGLQETQHRQASLKKMETSFMEALKFVGTCQVCDDEPDRQGCRECTKGSHKAHLPQLIDAFMHREGRKS